MAIIACVLIFTFTIADQVNKTNYIPNRTDADIVRELRMELFNIRFAMSTLQIENRHLRTLIYGTKPKLYDTVIMLLDENYKLELECRRLRKEKEDIRRELEKNYWEFFKPPKKIL